MHTNSLGGVQCAWAFGIMLIFIVVIKINRSGELNVKARGSQRAQLTNRGELGWREVVVEGGAGTQTELP